MTDRNDNGPMAHLLRSTRRAAVAFTTCLLVSTQLYSNADYSFGSSDSFENPASQRALSEVAEAASARQAPIAPIKKKCEVKRPNLKPTPPTLTSSYPGSGAKVTWKLIRSITNLMTGDDYDHNGQSHARQAVSIKTHYPSHTPYDVFGPFANIDRAILLLRNPMNAIPSYHNYLFEVENKLVNHSTRAPVEAWLKWRDEHFETELERWREHTQWWMERYDYWHRLVVSYEELTSAGSGPKVMGEIGEFLLYHPEVAETTVTDPEELKCLWDAIVNRNAGEGTRAVSKRAGGPVSYPYTDEQLRKMEDVVERLRERWIGPLGGLMSEYLVTIRKARAAQSEGDNKGTVRGAAGWRGEEALEEIRKVYGLQDGR